MSLFSDLPVILVNSYDEIKTIQKEYDFFEKNIEKPILIGG